MDVWIAIKYWHVADAVLCIYCHTKALVSSSIRQVNCQSDCIMTMSYSIPHFYHCKIWRKRRYDETVFWHFQGQYREWNPLSRCFTPIKKFVQVERFLKPVTSVRYENINTFYLRKKLGRLFTLVQIMTCDKPLCYPPPILLNIIHSAWLI